MNKQPKGGMQLAETDLRNFRKVKRVEYSKWGWCEKKQDLVTMKECEDCGYHEAVFPEGPYVYSLCSWKPTEAPEEMCPMCPLRKYEHGGRIHGLGSRCTQCGLEHS